MKIKIKESVTTDNSFSLNTDVLPIVNVNLYDILYDFDIDSISDIDEACIDIAIPIIEKTLSDVLGAVSISNTSMYHPRYYNYDSDTLDFTVTFDLDRYNKLKSDTINNPKFKSFLAGFRSAPGFISYFASDMSEFNEQEDWRSFCQIVRFNISKSVLKSNDDDFMYRLYDYLSENFDRIDEYEDYDEV